MMQLIFLSTLGWSQGNPPPPIVNGTETDRFIQTGALMYRFNDYADVFCSGTLVHKKWVVSAAHCIDALDEYSGYGAEMLFVLGDSLYSTEGVEDYDVITFWKQHPDYRPNQRLEHDIGVIELENGFEDIEPIALGTQSPSGWSGQEIFYIGWGITRDNRSDSGKKRMASIEFYDYDEQFVYSIDPSGEQNLCSGDSGGSALRIQPDGSYVLVGVNSFVFGVYENAACSGGGSGAARVDSNYEWLKGYIPDPEPLSYTVASPSGCSHQGGWSTFQAPLVLSMFSLLVVYRRR